jgi:type IV pilus biogenesis protein CpaD/CtpE
MSETNAACSQSNTSFCSSKIFRSAAQNMRSFSARYQNIDAQQKTVKIASSGNDPTMTTAAKYAQYVSKPNPAGIWNTKKMKYNDYVNQYGPLPQPCVVSKSDPRFKKSWR